jgi:CPA2 family monovalent cation:H+ antiporter-2
MAIQRANGEEIDYPQSQTTFILGDRLLVVGSDDELAALVEFAQRKVNINLSESEYPAIKGFTE